MTWFFRALWLVAVGVLIYFSLTSNTGFVDAVRPSQLDLLAEPPGFSAPIPKDKLSHFFAFFVIGSITPLARLPLVPSLFTALILLAAIGGGIELAQGEVAGRSRNGLDMLANLLGAIAGLTIGGILEAIRKMIERFVAERA